MRSFRKRLDIQCRFIPPGLRHDQTAWADPANRPQSRQRTQHQILPIRRIEEYDIRALSRRGGQCVDRQHLAPIACTAGLDVCP